MPQGPSRSSILVRKNGAYSTEEDLGNRWLIDRYKEFNESKGSNEELYAKMETITTKLKRKDLFLCIHIKNDG